MYNKLISGIFLTVALTCLSCSSGYQMTGISRSRILVDSTFDNARNKAVDDFIAPYKRRVDSIMSPIVGRTACYMYAKRPESNLSNLLADILMWCGKDYGERPDFAIYNMGGIRSAFAKGDITYGDVLDVAPFENKICFVTLTGESVKRLFGQIAAVKGEAVSHGVELQITPDGRLISARLNGREIDPEARYRIATLDFVAQGNDNMPEFKFATDINSPDEHENNVRFIIMKYMKEMMNNGKEVNSQIEGRIKIIEQ